MKQREGIVQQKFSRSKPLARGGKNRHNGDDFYRAETHLMTDHPHDIDDPLDETEPLAESHIDAAQQDDAAISEPESSEPIADAAADSDSETQAVEEALAEEDAAEQGETDEFNIDLALASVATLSDALAQQEAEADAEIQRELAEQREAEQRAAERAIPFPAPPLTGLQRGSSGSFIPALLLMGIGGYLTFALSTQQTLPPTGVLVGIALASLALVLLARWFTTGRWGRGLLFAGTTLLLIGAALLAMTLALGAAGYPLLLAALGGGLLFTGLFGRPRDLRLITSALLLIGGGAAGLVVTLGLLPSALTGILAAWWFIPVAALILVAGAAFFAVRRGS
jgi:hypothetical protein